MADSGTAERLCVTSTAVRGRGQAATTVELRRIPPNNRLNCVHPCLYRRSGASSVPYRGLPTSIEGKTGEK